jgi:sulfofructose kinase
MAHARFDILGIGENATDTVLHLPQFPTLGSKIETLGTHILPGGQVATAMVACQRWGLRTHYVGSLGDDAFADLHRREFKRAGVHADLYRSRGTLSQMAFIFLDSHSGERTIAWRRDARLALPSSFLKQTWITSARLLHIDGHDPLAKRKAAAWARTARIPVVADFDHWSPALGRLLPLVDYPVTSRDFPLQASGEPSLLKALPQLKKKYGFRAICATLGIDGALAWDGARFWYAPSYKVRVRDTTGAGDLFHAAFSFGILRAWELQGILDFACAAAGLNCEATGARGGICDLKKIERLQRKGKRNRAAFP